MSDTVRIVIDGSAARVAAGTSVAAALLENKRFTFRKSVNGEPRGPICGMGICFECRVSINGRPHQRSCQIECRDGMLVETG